MVDNSNFMFMKKSTIKILCVTLFGIVAAASLMTVTSCESKQSASDSGKGLVAESFAKIDSLQPCFTFYPERWTSDGEHLWIVNSRDSFFLKEYDPVKNVVLWRGGSIGHGHNEYISPGIVEGFSSAKLALYSNTLNRIDIYSDDNGLEKVSTSKLPIWNAEHGIPKPYTRMVFVNDSTAIGTYFLPREAGAEFLDIKNGRLLSTLPLGVKAGENEPSGPYEFKVAADCGYAVAAYRYINRLEFFDIDSNGSATLSGVIGNDLTQTDLYNADRDLEMIKYYSDAVIHGGRLFTLYQGIEDGRIAEAKTHLEIYDLKTRKNVANINLGMECYEMQVMPAAGKIMLYSSSKPDLLYECDLP